MNYENRLDALAREIDANVARLEDVVRQARQEHQRVPIPGSLGTVTVDGTGRLVSVDLDPRALRTTNGRALGEQVSRSIQQAEAAATRRYQERVGVMKRHISL